MVSHFSIPFPTMKHLLNSCKRHDHRYPSLESVDRNYIGTWIRSLWGGVLIKLTSTVFISSRQPCDVSMSTWNKSSRCHDNERERLTDVNTVRGIWILHLSATLLEILSYLFVCGCLNACPNIIPVNCSEYEREEWLNPGRWWSR